MPKSSSPAKPRGRAKSKSDSKVEKERSKSRGRPKSRGRSPTPKAPKARKPSVKRSVSRPRSRARSKSRKSEPKPRSRSASRSSQAATKKAATPEPKKKTEPQPTRVSRRTIAAREASKGKAVVDGPAERRAPEKLVKFVKILLTIRNAFTNFGYKTTLLGLFWFIVLPLYVGVLHLFCTRDRCYPRWPIIIPNSIQTYVDPVYIAYGAIIIFVQAILSAIPIGPIVSGFGYRRAVYKYRSNGLLCFVISFGLYYWLVHHVYFHQAFLLVTNRFKCLCAMTIVSLCYTVLLWAKSYCLKGTHLNHGSPVSYAANGNVIHDLAHGREVSPKIGETYDLGLILLRSSNFIWFVSIYSAAMLSKTEHGYNKDVMCLVFAQFIHIFTGAYFEMNILKSAFINQGVGFITVFSTLVITPFCHTLPIRYVLDNKTHSEPLPVYIAVFVAYMIGLILIFYTNCAKYLNARSGGKKVLRTGCYSIVRHPNYLGELLCLVASTALCGKALLPWVHCVYLVGLLFCRMRLMERNTNYEYKQYAEQVRSRLIPFIY